jgi:ferredoxin
MPQIFPRGANLVPLMIALILGALGTGAVAVVWYYFTPKYTKVGYMPPQPVPFSHKIHAGQLGIDCRYCHSFVETSAHSNIPTAQVCMTCHSQIQKDNPKLEPVRQAFATGKPIQWVQIHKTPDHAYFNHAVHVNRGVSCVTCHGRVDQMDEVYQAQPLTMSFCIDCHRAPETELRPLDKVTDLGWKAPNEAAKIAELLGKTPKELNLKPDQKLSDAKAQAVVGNHFKSLRGVQPPDSNCAGCHR